MPYDPNSDVQDWSDVPDAQEFPLIPEGHYHVVCTEMQRGISQNDNPKWEFRLQVLGGEYHGAEIIDNITFTEGAVKRARAVLSRLGGIDMTKRFDLRKVDLTGCQAIAHVIVEKREYQGREISSNKISFAGYDRPEGFQPWSAAPAPPAPPPAQHQQPIPAAPIPAAPAPAPVPVPPVPAPAPPQPARVAPPQAPPMQLSPDGMYAWNGQEWIPNQAPPPAPPQAAPPQAPPAPPQAPPQPNGTAPQYAAAGAGAPGRADKLPF